MAKKVPIVQATFYNNNTKQIENCYPMTSAKGVIMSDGKTLEESFSDKADDTNVVHKSGDEEILGMKTFDDLRTNGFCLSDEGDRNRWVSAFYSFLKNQGVIQFGTEEDWSVILRNIANPEYENDAATKGYVDIKIGDASIPVLQYGVLINNDLPSILESKEQAIANAPIYTKILSGEVKFFAAKAGADLFISSKIQITNEQANVTLLGLKVPSLTLHIVQMTIGQSGLSSKINLWMNLQSALTDTDGSYGQRVAELEEKGIASEVKLTELGTEVNSINLIFGKGVYRYGYITTGDVGAVVSSLESNGLTYWKSIITSANAGDKFYIKGKGGGNARLWAFLDTNNVVLSSSSASYISSGEEIVAPSNSALLVVNFANPETDSSAPTYNLYQKSRYDEEIIKQAESIREDFSKLSSKVLEANGIGYLFTNVGIGNYVDLTHTVTQSYWRYYISDVREGQILRLEECQGGGNSRLWAFVDENSNLISISESSAMIHGKLDIEIPSNAKKVIINNNKNLSPGAKFTIYYPQSLDIRIEEIEEKLEFSNTKTNVLIFGNSYSYRSIAQGEGNILNLARSIKADLFVEVIGNGGGSFESNYTKHLNGEKNDYRWEGDINTGIQDKSSSPLTLKEALEYREWDYIIFHQASRYSGNIDSFSPYLDNLIVAAKTYCKNENVKIGLMQTWAYADITLQDSGTPVYPTTSTTTPSFPSQEEMYDAICNTYKQALNKFEDISFLIPAGTAIQNARATELGTNHNDFGASSSDGSHTNSEGTLITSLVVFNKVFGEMHNIKLSEIQNNYSILFNDDEFALAVESARMAIKFPFKVMLIV